MCYKPQIDSNMTNVDYTVTNLIKIPKKKGFLRLIETPHAKLPFSLSITNLFQTFRNGLGKTYSSWLFSWNRKKWALISPLGKEGALIALRVNMSTLCWLVVCEDEKSVIYFKLVICTSAILKKYINFRNNILLVYLLA